MSAIVKVAFHGDSVECVRDSEGTVWVVLAPLCARLGQLEVATQVKKLKEISHMARVGKIPTRRSDGQVTEQWSVDLDGLAAWLMSISLRRVSAEVRPLLERYQRDGARVLRAHFFGSSSQVEPATEPKALVAGSVEAKAAVVRLLGEPNMMALFGPELARTKAEHLLAEVVGHEPQAVAPRMLTISDYLAEKGLSAAAQRSLAPTFGKLVKAAYWGRHGKAPPLVERFVDGATRPVCGYTELDRPLFEAAWAQTQTPALTLVPGGGEP